jgi:sec-independent protein translocase protein TatB
VFDIGFSELIVCAIVALIVIGPERMPEAVRTVGLWIGRFKRSLRETRSEIERQMGMDDIRRQLHNEEIMRDLEQARLDMDKAISETQHAIQSSTESVTREYTSEPDLPYHAHTEEHAENLVKLPEANTELNKTTSTETFDEQTPVANPQASTQQTPDNHSAPASNKVSL